MVPRSCRCQDGAERSEIPRGTGDASAHVRWTCAPAEYGVGRDEPKKEKIRRFSLVKPYVTSRKFCNSGGGSSRRAAGGYYPLPPVLVE